nr:hypothetical protein [Tanacetum cinerariifolium]
FSRILDNKLEDRERMWNSIQNEPYKRPMIPNPDNTQQTILEPSSKMTEVSINTKFLNCLQPEWSKYVTMVHHNQTGDTVSYDALYDSLVQFEPYVLASKAKKAAKNHDPLARLVHSNASSSQSHANSSYSPQPYYVTHSSSVVDYEDEYQEELQRDSQEDKLTTAMMMVELTYKLRIQVMEEMVTGMQGDKTGIKHLMQEMEMMTVIRMLDVFQELSQLQERQMFSVITTMKKAIMLVIVKNQEFMMQKTMKELTAAVMLMARIQPADGNAKSVPSYDAKAVSEVNASSKFHEQAFKERENWYLEDIVDLEEKLSSHDQIVYKMGQSIKTIHMLEKKRNEVYDHFLKAGLGYKNPERLKKAIAAQPKMYNGERLHNAKLIIDSPDSEETLEDAEESRLKMRNKIVQINYGKLNVLYETFVPQQEFSVEQTYFPIPSTSINGSESKEVTSDLPIAKMSKESKLLKMFDTMSVTINS